MKNKYYVFWSHNGDIMFERAFRDLSMARLFIKQETRKNNLEWGVTSFKESDYTIMRKVGK